MTESQMMKSVDMSNTGIQSRLHRCSQIYSKFLIRFSWSILLLSFVVTVGLTISFLYLMRARSFDQSDFLLVNGRTASNIQRLRTLFGNDQNFRVHQQMDLYPALDVIIRRKESPGNMLDETIIDEIHRLDHHIQSLRINHSRSLNYSSLCAIINHVCSIDGNYLLSKQFRHDLSNLPFRSSGIYSSEDTTGISSFMFSKHFQVVNATPAPDYVDDEEEEEEESVQPPLQQIISYVPIFRLRYSLNVSTDEMRDFARMWEREILRHLNTNFQSDLIYLSISSSTAISDTVSQQAQDEGHFMLLILVIFFISLCLLLSAQGSFYTSVEYFPICGIVSFALSTGATFGLLTVFRIQIIGPMALIVFVVAIIDCMRMSIICGEYHRIIKEHPPQSSTTKIDIDKILPVIIESSYPQMFSSLIILILVYLSLALISSISCVKLLSLTLIFYLLVNCITHCTFFGSCLVLMLKRIRSRRDCLFCCRLSADQSSETPRESPTNTFAQKRKKVFAQIPSYAKKLGAGCFCLFLISSMIISIWLVLSIDTRLFEDRFLPKGATSLRSYMKSQVDDYDIGPMIMFTIPTTIDYASQENRLAIRRIVEQCQGEKRTNNFTLLWLDQEDLQTLLTSQLPLALRMTPYSLNDLIIKQGKNQSVIAASRFYCQFQSIQGDREDLRTMNRMYKYARESELPSIFPYSVVFPHYESLEQIRKELCLTLLLLVIISSIVVLLVSFSFWKALLLSLHLSVLLCGTLACLYLFHHLTFNFANALWLYLVPVIYLEAFVHVVWNENKKSKWNYNCVLLTLFLSLLNFLFFPIDTYIFHVICTSVIYESVLAFVLINFTLPSCFYILRTKGKRKSTTTLHDSEAPENDNLVPEPNGHAT